MNKEFARMLAENAQKPGKTDDPLFEFPEEESNTPKSFFMTYKQDPETDKPDLHIGGNLNPDDLEKILDHFKFHREEVPSEHPNSDFFDDMNLEPYSMNPSKKPFYDIFETDETVQIVVEMPRYDKKEIDIRSSNKEININGFMIPLPCQIDQSSAISRLNNGILEIHARKSKKP